MHADRLTKEELILIANLWAEGEDARGFFEHHPIIENLERGYTNLDDQVLNLYAKIAYENPQEYIDHLKEWLESRR